MLFPDESSIALKELSGIFDELLARRHRLRFSGLRIRKLLCHPRHFAIKARLIPRRLCAVNARVVVDKSQMGIFELLHPELARRFGDGRAGTE